MRFVGQVHQRGEADLLSARDADAEQGGADDQRHPAGLA
jgi:hypothetical protein